MKKLSNGGRVLRYLLGVGLGTGLLVVLPWGSQNGYAAQPAATTAAHLVNPKGFINNGTIHLKPAGSNPPPPTTITVDTTLNPLSSGAIAGTPIAGQTGDLYTISPTYGVTHGANEFFSFSTFNVGTGDTAQFQVPNGSITNIISRVTGVGSVNGLQATNIDGTVNSPVSLWFINPMGIIVTKNAAFNVSGALALGAADYITFPDGTVFYALPSNGTSTALTMSTTGPESFGFLSNSQAGAFSANGWSLTNAPGSVTLAGGSVTLTDSQIVPTNSGSPIDLVAGTGDLTLAGSTKLFTATFPASLTDGGDISISAAGAVNITGSPIVDSYSYGTHNAGNITITAASMSAGNSSLSSYEPGVVNGGFDISSVSAGSGTGGTITLNTGNGPLNLYGGFITAQASKLDPYSGGGSAGSVYMYAGSITVVGSDIAAFTYEKGDAGIISLNATSNVSAQFSLLSSAAQVAPPSTGSKAPSTTIGGANGVQIFAGQDINLTSTTVDAYVQGTATNPNPQATGGLLELSAGRNITISSSQLDAHSEYAGVSGDIYVDASGTIAISGQPWTLFFPEVPDSVTSASINGGTPGYIQIKSNGGIIIDGGASVVSNVVGSANISPAFVDVQSTASSVTISDAEVSATSSNGGGEAGFITISGNSGVQLNSGSIVSTSVSGGQGSAGDIVISSPGLLTIADSTISSSSSNTPFSAGNLSLSGSGVLINQQSLISANFSSEGNGATAGAPGSVAIFASGTTGANDPLSNNLSAPTAGVVRIVDSAVTATNSGGTGINKNVGILGQLWIGADLPGASGTVSDNVIIAGSVLSTDVSAGGIGNNLTVEARNGVWIGASPTGGYPLLAKGNLFGVNDIRKAPTQSLITSQIESSAVSGGQVLIQGGIGGVTIVSSNVDANNAVDGSNSGSTFVQSNVNINVGSTSGAVELTDSFITTKTSGVDPAGNILVTADSARITGSLVSAATMGTGGAGNIDIKATGADQGSSAALQVTGGSMISSDAGSGTSASADAGVIVLSATNSKGSVQIGLPGENQTKVTSSAGVNAGTAGAVTVNAGKGITLGAADIETTAGGSASDLAGTNPGSITLLVNDGTLPLTTGTGPITISNSKLDASTSGAQAGGEIDLNGSQVAISNTKILAQTSGTAAAGAIHISAYGTDSAKGAALQVTDASMISSDATSGTSTSANAGIITLDAPNAQGSVWIGLPGQSQTVVSSSSGPDAGLAGQIIVFAGKGINVGSAVVETLAGSNGAIGTLGGNITLLVDDSMEPQTIGTGPITIANSTLNASTSGQQAAGNMQITGSTVNVTGSAVTASTTGSGAAGAINIGAFGLGKSETALEIVNSTIFSDASNGQGPSASAGVIELSNIGSGAIQATGSTISTSAGAKAGSVGYIFIQNEGQVSLTGDNLLASTESAIPSPVKNGASIDISTTGQVSLKSDVLTTETYSSVAARDIQISGSQVSISSKSQIDAQTFGSGNAGNVTITASGADQGGVAALEIAGGSKISSDATAGTSGISNAGAIILTATDPHGSVQIGLPGESKTIVSSSTGSSAGSAGTVTVTAGNSIALGAADIETTAGGTASDLAAANPGDISLVVNNGTAPLTTGTGPITIANSTLNASTSGAQGAGDIKVLGDAVSIDPSTISTSTNSTASAGDITITAASGSLVLNAATIESESKLAASDAGAVGVIDLTGDSVSIVSSTVSASKQGGVSPPVGTHSDPNLPPAIVIRSGLAAVVMIADSKITTSAAVSTGGNIQIDAGGSPLTLNNSTISASAGVDAGGAATGGGNGGNISILNAGNTVLSTSGILAETPSGSGGQINIGLKPGSIYIQDSQSKVAADSGNGNNGKVTINSPQTNFNSALATPDVSVTKAPELARNACQRDQNRSTFVREGRGGVAASPDGYQSAAISSQASAAGGAKSPSSARSTSTEAPRLLASAAGCQ